MSEPLSEFNRQELRLHQSLTRFAAVGVINTIADIGTYTLLRSAGVNVLAANTCSTSLGLIISFTLNRRYTFQAHGSALKRQVMRFFPITLISLWLLQPLVIFATRDTVNSILNFVTLTRGLHASIIIPKLLATIVSLIWNYIWYSRYVFKTSD